jgi:protein SCO1
MLKRKWWLILIGLVLGIGAAVLLAWRFTPHKFHGTVIQSPDPAPNFTLTTKDGKQVSLSDLRGRLVVLYFGYTYCPDICPATLSELAGALKMMKNDADKVQVVMVSVDPERDTPDRVAEYVKRFNPGFIGLSGTLEEISQAAALYGVYFAKRAGSAADKYTMDHTASLMVIDPQGHLKLILPFGVKPSEIAEDLTALLR